MNSKNKREHAAAFAVRPVALAVGLALASLAQAQDSAPAKEETKLESVVVTANKRAQNLQDVPAAITVLTDAVLQRNNVKDFDDLPALSPALSVSYSTQPGNYSINLRGIGTFSLGIGVEPDVAVVIDDIPYAMQANAFKNLNDVQRIEILKGPQSTLLGKSSIAGAVSITTKPIDGLWKTRASVLMSNDSEWRANASVSGALSDTVRMRLAVSKTDFPGVVRNLTDGGRMNGSNDTSVVGKLEWTPGDQWQVVFAPRAAKFEKNCCVTPFTFMSPGGVFANTPSLPASTVLKGINIGPGNVSVRNDFPAGGSADDVGAGLKAVYSFDDRGVLAGHTLASITSWSHYRMDDYQDGDGTDTDLGLLSFASKPAGFHGGQAYYGAFDVESRTQELRLTSPDKARLRYVLGLWYAKNNLARDFIRGPLLSPPAGIGTGVTYNSTAYNTNRAIFGQGSFDITPQTGVSLGLRYNREETGYTFTSIQPLPGSINKPGQFFRSDDDENKVTGKASLEHRFDPYTMAYVSYATGHKGKAYDLTSSFDANVARNMPVPGEDAKSYEAGVKMTLLNGAMALDLAAFRTNFTGFQQSASFMDTDGIFRTQLHSIGALRTQGIEADLGWRVNRQLVLNGAYAFTRATIRAFPNGPCYAVLNAAGTGTANAPQCAPNRAYGTGIFQDLAGATLTNAPKHKLNLSGQYDIPLERSYNAFVTGAYRFQSPVQYSLNQNPLTTQGSYGIFNLGFGIREKKDAYKLSFMVNNLFDKSYATNLAQAFRNGAWSTTALMVNTANWMPARDYKRYFTMRADFTF
ncbi:TonB-dependent receptor [Massilia sp. G4R7]|uniref:TonB-dependent receptor n=1 Tax=Massilia phyllostachyos TaxID=2898585 RepID=A0ABS8Q9H1_9BURK|nr:TonB-dependent receptor [Massilia phyllostachyos]